MLGSLWAGISGLNSQQTALDNESHNISNVNTVGFKSSRVSFADMMYDNGGVGKGSLVGSTDKLYTQGAIKVTTNTYDLAISGRGFISVQDPNNPGSEYFTRSGNLHMAQDGTLHDSGAFEVLGWAMQPIDTINDVDSTISGVTTFTSDYTTLAANKIIETSNDTIETITAKLSDYATSAATDSIDVMSGYGYKTKSTKVTDVELLMRSYQSALDTYASDTTVSSSAPTVQQSTLSFPSLASSQISADNDKLYTYINGEKIEQNFVSVISTEDYDGTGAGSATNNLIASKVATYQALTDQISNKVGYEAYISDSTGNKLTALDYQSFSNSPYIQINGLVPGESFTLGDIGEYIYSSDSNIAGNANTVDAISGSGEANVEAIKDALLKAAAGFPKQVWGSYELTNGSEYVDTMQYELTLDDGTVLSASSSASQASYEATIDDLVTQINSGTMSTYVTASNQNGNLVIESTDPKFELNGSLTALTTSAGAAATISGTVNKSITNSISSGADAEFLQIKTSVSNAASSTRSELQLNLTNLGISENGAAEFEVSDTGIITMKQDGAYFAVGQVSLASFNSVSGLKPEGDNLYSKTLESGDPQYSKNNLQAGKVLSSSLELSTTTLSESLVNLMVYQRAFEANSKSITTSDALLNTLIQLKK